MHRLNHPLRRAALAAALLAAGVATAGAQTARGGQDYSDSDAHARARSSRHPLGDTPAEILRNARTIYVAPNRHIEADYLEYKLDKLPEFNQWQLSIVKDARKADLVLTISKTALNYVFSVSEPESSIVVVKGKVVAINGLVAAEDISHQIVKRMKSVRALPTGTRQ